MKRSRWLLAWAILLLMVPALSASSTWAGYPVVTVLVGGKTLRSDVPAIILDGRTLVPLRSVAEALGAEVQWDSLTYTVSITTRGQSDQSHSQASALRPGQDQYWHGYRTVNVQVNGIPILPDVPAIIIDGRTMVPLRAVSESLGAQIQWDAQTYTVTVSDISRSGATPEAPGVTSPPAEPQTPSGTTPASGPQTPTNPTPSSVPQAPSDTNPSPGPTSSGFTFIPFDPYKYDYPYDVQEGAPYRGYILSGEKPLHYSDSTPFVREPYSAFWDIYSVGRYDDPLREVSTPGCGAVIKSIRYSTVNQWDLTECIERDSWFGVTTETTYHLPKPKTTGTVVGPLTTNGKRIDILEAKWSIDEFNSNKEYVSSDPRHNMGTVHLVVEVSVAGPDGPWTKLGPVNVKSWELGVKWLLPQSIQGYDTVFLRISRTGSPDIGDWSFNWLRFRGWELARPKTPTQPSTATAWPYPPKPEIELSDLALQNSVKVLTHRAATVSVNPEVTRDSDWSSVTLTQGFFKGAQRFVPAAQGTIIGPIEASRSSDIIGVKLEGMIDPWTSWKSENTLQLVVEASTSPSGPWYPVMEVDHPKWEFESLPTLLPAVARGRSVYFRLTARGAPPPPYEWGYSSLTLRYGYQNFQAQNY